MHERRTPNPARLLAPAALAAVTLALLVVVLSSGSGGGGDDGTGSRPPGRHSSSRSRQTSSSPGLRNGTYTVKTGDTLGGIAGKTGVSVDKLLELNPQLDPQALVSGQKIKLRE
jgi:LysM domain